MPCEADWRMVRAMSYLPTICDKCRRLSLVASKGMQEQWPTCPGCVEPLRVVPSCSYRATDLQLFRELSDTVAEGVVGATEASSLAQRVRAALWSGAYRPELETLVTRLPGLVPQLVAMGQNRMVQHHNLQLLRTIFEAVASTRSASGIMAAVQPADVDCKRQA